MNPRKAWKIEKISNRPKPQSAKALVILLRAHHIFSLKRRPLTQVECVQGNNLGKFPSGSSSFSFLLVQLEYIGMTSSRSFLGNATVALQPAKNRARLAPFWIPHMHNFELIRGQPRRAQSWAEMQCNNSVDRKGIIGYKMVYAT